MCAAYDRPKVRVDRMIEGVEVMRRAFADGPFDFAGAHYTISVVRFYAAVSFDEDGQFLLVDYLSDLFDLRSDIWDERLAAETDS